jgi:hypothetical protein
LAENACGRERRSGIVPRFGGLMVGKSVYLSDAATMSIPAHQMPFIQSKPVSPLESQSCQKKRHRRRRGRSIPERQLQASQCISITARIDPLLPQNACGARAPKSLCAQSINGFGGPVSV